MPRTRRLVHVRRRVLFPRVRTFSGRPDDPAVLGRPGMRGGRRGMRGVGGLLRRHVHGGPLRHAASYAACSVQTGRRSVRRQSGVLRSAMRGRTLCAPPRVPRPGRALRLELRLLQLALCAQPARPRSLRRAVVHGERSQAVHASGRGAVRGQRRLLLAAVHDFERRRQTLRRLGRLPGRVRALLHGRRLLLRILQRARHGSGRMRAGSSRVRRRRRALRGQLRLLHGRDVRHGAATFERAPVPGRRARRILPLRRRPLRAASRVLWGSLPRSGRCDVGLHIDVRGRREWLHVGCGLLREWIELPVSAGIARLRLRDAVREAPHAR
jgi:hypothetical protein